MEELVLQCRKTLPQNDDWSHGDTAAFQQAAASQGIAERCTRRGSFAYTSGTARHVRH